MKSYSSRPSSLYTDNHIRYFPNGKVNSDDTSNIECIKYIDENDIAFYICYTQNQILNEVKNYGFFSPFIPLFICHS